MVVKMNENERKKIELKLNNKIKKFRYKGIEINVKPFLLSAEIETIVQSMLKEDDYLSRIMTRDILLINFCTNIEVEKDKDGYIIINNSIYDLYKTNGIIDKVLSNIEEDYLLLIDEYIYNEEKATTVLKDFLKGLKSKIDEISKKIETIDFNKITNQLLNKKKDIKND